jgi:exopolysaccharide biosynthesis WecB/TagA/CpsF family protein
MSAKEILSTLSNVAVIEDADHYERRLDVLCKPQQPYVLSFINQHGFNMAHTNEALRDALRKSDCLLRDGVGLEVAFQVLGLRSGVNCNGTDLIPKILSRMKGQTAAIFGTNDPWLTTACDEIKAMGVHVVSKLDGFKEDEEYVTAIRDSRPDLVILGMGMPRQEVISMKIAQNCEHACLIVNGGAIIDFIGNRFVRAPEWVRGARLEWLFRLLLEPKRLFRRYVTGGALFVFRVIKLACCARIPGMQMQIAAKS